jgi:hypothetical protein
LSQQAPQQQQQSQQQAAAPVVPAKGTPEYIKFMADKWDATQTAARADRVDPFKPQPQKPATQQQPTQQSGKQKPEGVPDKFWNAEKGEVDLAGLAKSYTELEKARSRGQQPAQQPVQDDAAKKHAETKTKLETDLNAVKAKQGATPEEIKAAQDALDAHVKTPAPDAAQQAVKDAGLDWDTLSTKINSSGDLEEADYAALEKAGIPRSVSEGYIETMKEAKQLALERTQTYVGGEQKLNSILNRAAQELTPEEKSFYNTQLASKSWKTALDTLKQRFGDETDNEPKGQILNGQPSGSGAGYASQAEQASGSTRSALQDRPGVPQASPREDRRQQLLSVLALRVPGSRLCRTTKRRASPEEGLLKLTSSRQVH